MYKEILRSIAGIEVFPLISLGLFLAVFAGVLIAVARMDAPRIARLSRLPLDAEPPAGMCPTLSQEYDRD